MQSDSTVTIAVDAMGGDHAPDVVLEGVDAALAADSAVEVLLVGPEGVVSPFASARERVTAVPASEVIGMGEHPANAVRAKKDSSIVVGCSLVRDGRAAAFFTAGSTGAGMAAATLVVGRITGVHRPAIGAIIPTPAHPIVFLDIGANADCRPEYLMQFALMGSAYAMAVLGVEHPSVGLLNIGEEPTKGSQLALEAHRLMAEHVPGFVGNVEGRDIPAGTTDVIVTDGFTGNVALKLMEGLSKTLLAQVKEAITSSTSTKLAGAALKRPLTELRARLDPEAYGGAPLLGIDGVCLIGHGSSRPAAIASGIRASTRAVRAGLTDHIARVVSAAP